MSRTVLVVGASVAGVRAAQGLRAAGFDGRVVLVGDEDALPYDKPPLSKQFLAGDWDAERIGLLSAEAAERDRIELRLGAGARGLDLSTRQIQLNDGTVLDYDVLVIATGASARQSPWQPASGLHVVRTFGDAVALRDDLRGGGPVVIVGGGFVGAEVASTARRLGHEVTMVDPLTVPISRVVGAHLGQYFVELHRRHGVDARFGIGVDAVDGVAGDLRVRLSDGAQLSAATVVVGIGAVPNDAWLAGSGLRLEDGVLCDEFCRALGAPDVYAIGDVARRFDPGSQEYVRVEHWTNAVEQGQCVAHNIAEPADLRAHRAVDYVWSDQYDWRTQIAGRPMSAARYELVGELEGEQPRAAALYRDESDHLCGALTVNWPKAFVLCRRLLGGGVRADEAVEQVRGLTAAPVSRAVSVGSRG